MVKKEKSNDFIETVQRLAASVQCPLQVTLVISADGIIFDSLVPCVDQDHGDVDSDDPVAGPVVQLQHLKRNNYIG